MKPEKVKSRWRRNSEMESCEKPIMSPKLERVHEENSIMKDKLIELDENVSKNENISCKYFQTYEPLEENLYLFERKRTKRKKEVRRMLCDCAVISKEEFNNGILGCQDECLNRLLMIECGSRCANGDVCSNKRFQKRLYAKAEPFKTERKGWGLKLLEDMSRGNFIIEYCGEILNMQEFKQRVKQYARKTANHYYFMSLKSDAIIDATQKGNLSRFINHACEPNCETQKWTVNGELRIGFFAKRDIKAGEELTFDYQFERYGREAQKCYCESEKCNGFIGVSKSDTIDIYEKSSKTRKKSEEKKREKEREVLPFFCLEEEIEKLYTNGSLRNKEDTLLLARLMVRAEDTHSREKLLDIILGTTEVACLRLFLNYHGLSLLWSWMADLNDISLKTKILKSLSLLPVPNRTMLLDSKILTIVEKWAGTESDCGNIFCDQNEKSLKRGKFCDTSDSETDGGMPPINSQSSFAFSTQSDNILCVVTNGPNTNICVDSNLSDENKNIVVNLEEISFVSKKKRDSDNKASQADNTRSDSESGDMLDDENIKSTKSNAEISNLAKSLLGSWRVLKEEFRIPRRGVKKEQDVDVGVDLEFYGRKQTQVSKFNNIPHQSSEKQNDICVINEDKPQEIKVVCNMDEKFSCFQRRKREYNSRKLSLDEKRSFFAQEMQRIDNTQHRRKKLNHTHTQEKPLSKFSPFNDFYPENHIYNLYNTVNHSSNENFQFVAPPLSGSNALSNSSYFVETNNSPRPPLLPTPAIQPNTMYVNTCQAQNPSETFSQNIFVPPPAQVAFIGLPPPSFLPQKSPNIAHFPSNLPAASQHLIGIPSPAVCVVNSPNIGAGTASASDPLATNYINTQIHNEFIDDQNSMYIQSAATLPCHHVENTQQQTYTSAQENEEMPVKMLPAKLPPNWRTATDEDGNTYYYHMISRKSQWDPPPGIDEEISDDIDNSTPTYDEPKHSLSKRKSTTTAPADTSSNKVVNIEIAKKIKELFRTKMSSYVVQCLNPYLKDDCRVGRITTNGDFKHLARKLTHFVMAKELKHCKNVEDLDCNENVKNKARDYIHKYMARYGPLYRKEKSISFVDDKV